MKHSVSSRYKVYGVLSILEIQMSPAFNGVMYEKKPGIYGINCVLLCTKLMMHFCVCFIILICVNNHIYFIILQKPHSAKKR